MSKIGILGGTFNPIHKGHIMLAEYCKNELALDKIVLIPTYTPPHKNNDELVSEIHRLNMCKLVCSDLQDYVVSDLEIERKGKSYTYQTIISLKEIYPNDTLYLIMGADMFLTLNKWKNPEMIFENTVIVAIPRNESDYNQLNCYYSDVIKNMGARAVILSYPVAQVSSTYIRNNIFDSDVISEFLNKNVYDYIVKNNLYRK